MANGEDNAIFIYVSGSYLFEWIHYLRYFSRDIARLFSGIDI